MNNNHAIFEGTTPKEKIETTVRHKTANPVSDSETTLPATTSMTSVETTENTDQRVTTESSLRSTTTFKPTSTPTKKKKKPRRYGESTRWSLSSYNSFIITSFSH